jgi:hypothetical protein
MIIGKSLEGRTCGIIKMLLPHFSGRPEENIESPVLITGILFKI